MQFGGGALQNPGVLMATLWATAAAFVFVVLGLVARLNGFSIVRFVRLLDDELLDDTAEPDQGEVDTLLGTLRGSTAKALPKGLSPTALDHVRDAVRTADRPLTASELAGRCGSHA